MTIEVRNPRTGEADCRFEPASPAAIAQAARRLRERQGDWFARGVQARAETLAAWADAIEAVKTELIAALAADTGRLFLSQREVDGAVANIRRWARMAPGLLQTQERPSALIASLSYDNQYVPYPLAGFITPWNFPVTLSLIDAVPALAAGCAALVKPSEVTPRFVEPLRKSIDATPGLGEVLAFVLGDGATGAALVERVDLICFTGSVATGRKVAAAAAGNFIPAFLELGGKDPAIVLGDADLRQATDAVLRGAILNSGQVCLSIERVYVQADLHDAFVDQLVAKAQAVEFNYPDIRRGELGPLILERQAKVIEAQLADAKARGAQVHCGGKVETLGGGLWLKPTVLTGATQDMDIMREETFGPVLPVAAFADEDQAVALANDTDFGLSASVIGGDLARVRAVAERVHAGGLSLNDCGLTSMTYEPEKTAFNQSGLGGSRMGPGSIHRFLRKKALIIQHGAPLPMRSFAEAAADGG